MPHFECGTIDHSATSPEPDRCAAQNGAVYLSKATVPNKGGSADLARTLRKSRPIAIPPYRPSARYRPRRAISAATKRRKLVRRRRPHRHEAEPGELRLHLRVAGDGTDLAVQRLDDAGRRAGRRHQHEPGRCVESLHPELGRASARPGSHAMRAAVVTPSMRSLPACASGCANGMGLNMNGMWPPATSLIAGDMPL